MFFGPYSITDRLVVYAALCVCVCVCVCVCGAVSGQCRSVWCWWSVGDPPRGQGSGFRGLTSATNYWLVWCQEDYFLLASFLPRRLFPIG